MAYSETFGKNIRRLRKASPLTQASLAEALNISDQAFRNYEGGKIPTPNILIKLPALLGEPLESLFSDPLSRSEITGSEVLEFVATAITRSELLSEAKRQVEDLAARIAELEAEVADLREEKEKPVALPSDLTPGSPIVIKSGRQARDSDNKRHQKPRQQGEQST